ncbi:hypothetical protein CEXT_786991, partial [Caerostris extrusa]
AFGRYRMKTVEVNDMESRTSPQPYQLALGISSTRLEDVGIEFSIEDEDKCNNKKDKVKPFTDIVLDKLMKFLYKCVIRVHAELLNCSRFLLIHVCQETHYYGKA